jgi:hypothetical protein
LLIVNCSRACPSYLGSALSLVAIQPRMPFRAPTGRSIAHACCSVYAETRRPNSPTVYWCSPTHASRWPFYYSRAQIRCRYLHHNHKAMKKDHATHIIGNYFSRIHSFVAVVGIVIAIICALVLLHEITSLENATDQSNVLQSSKSFISHSVIEITDISVHSVLAKLK